jgi:hypothetical protein
MFAVMMFAVMLEIPYIYSQDVEVEHTSAPAPTVTVPPKTDSSLNAEQIIKPQSRR